LLIDAVGIRATESLTAVKILQDHIAYCRGLGVTLGDAAFLYHQSVEDYLLGGRTSRAASGPLSDLVPFDKSQGHARQACVQVFGLSSGTAQAAHLRGNPGTPTVPIHSISRVPAGSYGTHFASGIAIYGKLAQLC
jgi:hypothetical protein